MYLLIALGVLVYAAIGIIMIGILEAEDAWLLVVLFWPWILIFLGLFYGVECLIDFGHFIGNKWR